MKLLGDDVKWYLGLLWISLFSIMFYLEIILQSIGGRARLVKTIFSLLASKFHSTIRSSSMQPTARWGERLRRNLSRPRKMDPFKRGADLAERNEQRRKIIRVRRRHLRFRPTWASRPWNKIELLENLLLYEASYMACFWDQPSWFTMKKTPYA